MLRLRIPILKRAAIALLLAATAVGVVPELADPAGAIATTCTPFAGPDTVANDYFGDAVAIDGDTAAIAAFYDDSYKGSVYIYKKNSAGNWQYQQTLTAVPPRPVDLIGYSVALEGDVLAVGSRHSANYTGAVYMFRSSGGTFAFEQKLTASDATVGDQFGYAVDVSGNSVIVGANNDDWNGAGAGSAYVFTYGGTSWTQQQKLTASDSASGDRFGEDVAIEGNLVAIGAPSDDDIASGAGSAYVFKRSGSAWTQQYEIHASDAQSGDSYGLGVDVTGSTMVVGAYAEDAAASGAGAAYVLVDSGGGFVETKKLLPSVPIVNEGFGFRVEVATGFIAVGAPGYAQPTPGSAYVFTGSGATWTEVQRVTESGTIDNEDRFGIAMAATASDVLIGIEADDLNGVDSGAACVRRPSAATCPTGPATYSATNTATLNAAIVCFNAATTPGGYVLNINSPTITLNSPTPTIFNKVSGVSLQVNGNGNTIDGAGKYRVLRIDGGTVGVNSLTVANGNSGGSFGGGIWVSDGQLTVSDSTITNSTASFGGGLATTGQGSLTTVNSTISGNTAAVAGGGFHNGSGSVGMVFSTVTANTAPLGSGVSSKGASGVATEVGGSIIAGNLSGNDINLYGGSTNSFVSEDFNVIGTGGATPLAEFTETNDMTGVADPVLGPLVNNGGPTSTHALESASPAIDRVSGALSPDPAVDQRGLPRPIGAAKDSGSFELGHDGLSVLAAPCALYDSVGSGDGALTPGVPRTIQVTNSCGVPAGASAAVITATAVNPQAAGNLRLSAAGVLPDGGVVNYINNGLNNTNTITVPLSLTGALDVAANVGASDVRLVVVGYHWTGSSTGIEPLMPCAVADSRSAEGATGAFVGTFAAGASYPDVDVVGTFNLSGDNQGGGATNCGVPANAAGVVLNVVAVSGAGGSGGLAVGPGGTEPVENTTNFTSISLNNAATAYVPLSGETVAVNITALAGSPSTHIRLVVLGYLPSTGGPMYTPVNPCAAFDSRETVPGDSNVPTGSFAGKRLGGDATSGPTPGTTTYNMTGTIPAAQGGELDCGVPEGVSAVLVNLVAIQADDIGNFRAYATGGSPTGGVLNFNSLSPPLNNANAVLVSVNGAGDIDLFVNAPFNVGVATTHARGIILGYYS